MDLTVIFFHMHVWPSLNIRQMVGAMHLLGNRVTYASPLLLKPQASAGAIKYERFNLYIEHCQGGLIMTIAYLLHVSDWGCAPSSGQKVRP